jgi:hypothetical protein
MALSQVLPGAYTIQSSYLFEEYLGLPTCQATYAALNSTTAPQVVRAINPFELRVRLLTRLHCVSGAWRPQTGQTLLSQYGAEIALPI